MKKSAILETLKDMPDEFSADELLERIILLKKIDSGILQLKDGKTYSQEDAEKKINKIPNALTVKTIEEARKGKGISKPIKDIKSFIVSL